MTNTQIADPLPSWLDLEAWAAFREMRLAKGKRAPYTQAAERRILFELDRLRAQGHPSGPVLWQSIVSGWSGVWPVKHLMVSGTVESMEVAQTRKLLADQAQHASQAITGPEVKERIEAIRKKLGRT